MFAVKTDGTDFTNLHSFTPWSSTFTNADGVFPYAGLVIANNTLYGTTKSGGSFGSGTVFRLNTDGTGFTTLHNFPTVAGDPLVNVDGRAPVAGLILTNDTLYGATWYGGERGGGTLFKLNTDGSGFAVLYALGLPAFLLGPPYMQINYGGTYANTLLLWGDTLYGTGSGGGYWGFGTVFSLKASGVGFHELYEFTFNPQGGFQPPWTTNSDGENPNGLVLFDNTLYGTTHYGGAFGLGTIFSFSPVPKLTITRSGQNVILSWPDAENSPFVLQSFFGLQSTADLSSSTWTTVSATPLLVNSNYVVTIGIGATQQFFRLSE